MVRSRVLRSVICSCMQQAETVAGPSRARTIHSCATARQAQTSASTSPSKGPTKISASIVLSRTPFLTRTPTPLESAVFAYNLKLHRHLSQPFPKDFYFKKGSAAETTFDQLEQERQKSAFAPPAMNKAGGKGKGKTPAAGGEQDASTSAAEDQGADRGLYAVLPRKTAADEANDVRSLERQGERTLYLVVKQGKAGWRFPADAVDLEAKEDTLQGSRDVLHRAAPRAVKKLIGDKLDIWMVTNMPVGLLKSGKHEKVSVVCRVNESRRTHPDCLACRPTSCPLTSLLATRTSRWSNKLGSTTHG